MLCYAAKSLYVIYACNIYREFIKDFRATKKIGSLRKFTISGDRESRDGGTFCWDNIVFFFHTWEIKMANRRENKMTEHILFMIFTKKTSVLSISDAN